MMNWDLVPPKKKKRAGKKSSRSQTPTENPGFPGPWEAQGLVQSHVKTEMKKKAEIEGISGGPKLFKIHEKPKKS